MRYLLIALMVVLAGCKGERECPSDVFGAADMVQHRVSNERAVVLSTSCQHIFVDTGRSVYWTRPMAWEKIK